MTGPRFFSLTAGLKRSGDLPEQYKKINNRFPHYTSIRS